MIKLFVVTAATALLALSFIDEAFAQRGGGVRGEGFQNPAQAAKAKSSKAKAGKANSGSTGKSGFEHQQCTREDPCKIYNF